MRADNTRHIITAARQRTKQTRQRAVTTLRRMDAAGQPITLASLASQAASPDPGSTGRTISSARSSVSATAARPPGAPRFRAGSAHPAPRCCNGWKPPPIASAAWNPKTSSSATPSPAPSANAGPPKSSGRPTAATRRTEKPRRSFDRAETVSPTCVGNTVLIVSAQVKAMIKVRAQDNPVDIQPAYDGHRDLLTLLRAPRRPHANGLRINRDASELGRSRRANSNRASSHADGQEADACHLIGSESQASDISSEPHPSGRSVSPECANTHRWMTCAVTAAGAHGGIRRATRKGDGRSK